MTTHHRYAEIAGRQTFYREAGSPEAPTVVLLHGTPASSHMYRNLIPALADRYTSSRPTTQASATPSARASTSSTTPSTHSPTTSTPCSTTSG